MRVLITGGAGFLGSHLSDAFIARGDEVFVLDTGAIAKVRHLMDNPRFHYVRDSVFNLEMIDSLISKADLIYHLAAVVGVEHYVGDPYEMLNVNVNGTQNVLKLAFKHGQAPGLQLDLRGLRPQSQGAVERGRRPRAGRDHDRSLVLLDLQGGRRALLLRLPQARAAGDDGPLLQHLRAAARPGRRRPHHHHLHGPGAARGRLTVIGDGKQTRCFTYVNDAVAATVAAGINPAADGEAINIGTDVETTILEFADLMIELYGSAKSKIKFVSQDDVYGQSYEDIPRRVPDNARMRTLLGVTPKVTLREGTALSMDWFRRELAG